MIENTGFPVHIHIVGIGGSATSGLAMLLQSWGHQVTGSDRDDSRAALFREHGIQFFQEDKESHLPADAKLVIRSRAIEYDHSEIVAANGRGVPTLLYSEALGRLSSMKKTIAIAGTHGKTSTTGVLTSIFLEAGRDPTVILGGELESIGGNWRQGDGEDFIVEACEFQRAFLDLEPRSGIITNIELDHPDTFDGLPDVEMTFGHFLDKFHPGSPVVMPANPDLTDRLVEAGNVRPIYFGAGEGDGWRGKISHSTGVRTIELSKDGVFQFAAEMVIPGTPAILNTTAAVALAVALGIEFEA
ncbi:MAG: Mur ligase domain-containing protein, partial [Planctomycetota bacterium]